MTAEYLAGTYDVLLFYAKSREQLKYRQPLTLKRIGGVGGMAYKRIRLPDLSERALSEGELHGLEELPAGSRVFSY